MKKILAVILLLAFSAACFAQKPVPVQTQTKEDLFRKSKNQKTTGFIMLGAGAAAVAGGVALMLLNVDPYGDPANSSRFDAGAVLTVAGGLAMGGGVVFLIVSGNNKQKANAMTASFKMEKGVPLMLRDMGPTYYPALSLKFNIR